MASLIFKVKVSCEDCNISSCNAADDKPPLFKFGRRNLFYRPFHGRNESWGIKTDCALVMTSFWLVAKVFKNFGPIGSRY